MEKTSNRVDRRVKKTKKAIRNAFAKLLAERDINEITIKDIADTADINRKTFYNHYSGIHQIVDEIENEIVSEFNQILGDINLESDLQNPYRIFEKLTAIINNDIDFYEHLLKIDSKNTLVPKITNALKEKIALSISLQTNMAPQTLDIVTEYIFSGMIGVYQKWFNTKREQSLEEISKTVSLITASGINGVIEN